MSVFVGRRGSANRGRGEERGQKQSKGTKGKRKDWEEGRKARERVVGTGKMSGSKEKIHRGPILFSQIPSHEMWVPLQWAVFMELLRHSNADSIQHHAVGVGTATLGFCSGGGRLDSTWISRKS